MSRQDEDRMVLTKTPENNVFYILHGKVLLEPNVIRTVRQLSLSAAGCNNERAK